MHTSVAEQSMEVSQSLFFSLKVEQKFSWQKGRLPEIIAHCMSVEHGARQTPFTHWLLPAHCAFDVQNGCGRSSTRQTPSSQ